MTIEFMISTGCCEDAEKYKVIVLNYPFSMATIDAPYGPRKPQWEIKGYAEEGMTPSYKRISNPIYCPFCAKVVPEIEVNQKAKKWKIHESLDGDYCDECGRRNMECKCLPPWFKWKPVGIEVIHPRLMKMFNKNK